MTKNRSRILVGGCNAWRWKHQGDGRVMRLFRGAREVLVIDKTRIHIEDQAGITGRYNDTIGSGSWPTWEDEKMILALLNKEK